MESYDGLPFALAAPALGMPSEGRELDNIV